MSKELSLGYIDLKGGPAVHKCKDCGSENVEQLPGEVSKEYISNFVRQRAQRVGIALADYDIKVDKQTGQITATPKDVQLEFDFS